MKKLVVLSAVALGLAFPLASYAGISPATGNFNVSIAVQKTCSVSAGASSDISLGSQVAGSTNVQGSNTFSVNCSKNTPFYIGLAPGGGSTTGAGTMTGQTTGNTDTVGYQLYSDNAYSNVWGDTATSTTIGNGVSGTGTGMGSGSAITETVYAKAPTTDVTPDTYSDTVTINVNY